MKRRTFLVNATTALAGIGGFGRPSLAQKPCPPQFSGSGTAADSSDCRPSSTKLSKAAANLSAGHSIRFGTVPVSALYNGDGAVGLQNIIQWGSSGAYDPINKKIQWLGKGAGGLLPIHWLQYVEDIDTWVQDPATPPPLLGGHGYDHTEVDPATGDLYHRKFGSAAKDIYKFNGASWEIVTTVPTSADSNGSITWVPGLGLVHTDGQRVQYYDGSWNTVTTTDVLGSTIHTVSQYNANSGIMIYGGGNIGDGMFKMDTSTLATSAIATPPFNLGSASPQGVLVDDPNSEKFIGTRKRTAEDDQWSYGEPYDWIEFDGTSWNKLTQSTGDGSAEQIGLPNLASTKYNANAVIAIPIREYGVIMYVHALGQTIGGEVWLYKHS